MTKIPPAFKAQAQLYLRCAQPSVCASDEALETQYPRDLFGADTISGVFSSDCNAYEYGKRRLDITIAMWRQAWAEGLLAPHRWVNDQFDFYRHKDENARRRKTE